MFNGGFRTQNSGSTMVWTRKKDTSEEMSYLVEQVLEISNEFIRGFKAVIEFNAFLK